MVFFPAGSASPAFYVKPTRNNMTKLSFQSAGMKSGLLGHQRKCILKWLVMENMQGNFLRDMILHCLTPGNSWRKVFSAISDILKQWLLLCSKFCFLHTVWQQTQQQINIKTDLLMLYYWQTKKKINLHWNDELLPTTNKWIALV